LLDLAVLEDLGLNLVLGVLGGAVKDLFDWTLECEIMASLTNSISAACSSSLASNQVSTMRRVVTRTGCPVGLFGNGIE
jgi:hypothetical protein